MNRLFLLLMWASGSLFAQTNKALTEAQKLFATKNYTEALPKYLEALQTGANDPLAFYQLAICYKSSQTIDEQVKGIPYYEQAINLKKDIPIIAYFDLATLYLRNEQLQKAQEAFSAYRDLVKADKKQLAQAEKGIAAVQNAKALMSVPRGFTVHSFTGNVNSKYTEYNPVVSADESVMAFTALRPNTSRTRSGDRFIESSFFWYNKGGGGGEPGAVPIASEYNVGTAGLTPDGPK
ncbi:MAG: tetratricopeptide repeat protein, partial [Cytophagales bacterium]